MYDRARHEQSSVFGNREELCELQSGQKWDRGLESLPAAPSHYFQRQLDCDFRDSARRMARSDTFRQPIGAAAPDAFRSNFTASDSYEGRRALRSHERAGSSAVCYSRNPILHV